MKPRTKRVLMTLQAEPYEKLQETARKAKLKKNWLGKEIDRLVVVLNDIVEELLKLKEEGDSLTEQEILKKIVETAESTFGVKLKDIMK